ncbi:MAG: PVC-type heme-binding CxxCH protein [Planctomycetota bacterium]
MMRMLVAAVVVLGGTVFSSARADEFPLNGQTFTLPPGFEIEAVAGSPLVDRPITAAFDEAGNLYVADSSGSNDKVDKQLAEKPHRIVRLSDTDGDGRFDKTLVFADKMMFPEGTMWLDGSLYVAAPPSIWKLTDTNGDGVADERSEWFQGKTLTGCANDLHGPYAGPDGWIYWCKGAFAEQTYERPGQKPFVTKAAHIFRSRPDGSGLEHVMTGGMDNPVDVVFTPGGERFFTTTFLQRPGGGKRDGVIHAVYGGVYGKVNGVLDGHPRTGDLMPVMSHLGPAAPSGLTRYASTAFGTEYRNNLFACCFNQHRIMRHVLNGEQAMYQSQDSDFVVSDNVDFHPTDILEDADGSLLILDTGGWYKLCCPTSQLSKPDVLGAIYRVRRKGVPQIADPRGTKLAFAKLTVAELVKLLADERPVVQERATKELARRGPSVVASLAEVIQQAASSQARCNAVWALTRIDHEAARVAIRSALSDRDFEVRQAALNSISLWRDAGAQSQLLVTLRTGSPMNQRLAAEALGRIGDPQQAATLLAAAAAPSDRGRDHAITYALLELQNAPATVAGLQDPNPAVQRTALYVLDQLEDGKLEPQNVAKLLASSDVGLKEAAAWVIGRHPEWSEALVGFFQTRLADETLLAADRQELERQLAQFATAASVQKLLADVVANPSTSKIARLSALQAMRASGLKELPAAWSAALVASLADADQPQLQRTLAVLRVFPPAKEAQLAPEIVARLQTVSGDAQLLPEIRLEALAVLATPPRACDDAQFALLTENLDQEKSITVRSVAAEVISKSQLTPPQLLALADLFKIVGPLEVDRLLSAYEQGGDQAVGLKLIAGLKEAAALKSLRPDALKLRLAKFSPEVQQAAQPLFDILNSEAGKQKERLEELLVGLKDGDIRRGQAVFYSQKASCVACHAIGYLGGNTGPDLTRVGGIRTERDLLESIVFPSVSFVRSYEPVTIVTTEGKVHNGLIRQETTDEITLATGPKEEVRIPRADVEELRPSTLSIMPAGLDQQLTRQQLADLIAFLKNCK